LAGPAFEGVALSAGAAVASGGTQTPAAGAVCTCPTGGVAVVGLRAATLAARATVAGQPAARTGVTALAAERVSDRGVGGECCTSTRSGATAAVPAVAEQAGVSAVAASAPSESPMFVELVPPSPPSPAFPRSPLSPPLPP